MTFEKSHLLKVAKLARLSLNDEEVERFANDLNRIVAFVAELNEVNVDKVAPMSHTTEQSLILREDVVIPGSGRECIRSSAGYEDGLVRVPKIID